MADNFNVFKLVMQSTKLRFDLPVELRNDDKWSNEDLHERVVQVAASARLTLRLFRSDTRDRRNADVRDHLHFTICGLLIDPYSHFAFLCPTLHSRTLKISLLHNSTAKLITFIILSTMIFKCTHRQILKRNKINNAPLYITIQCT
jgi:hypothetical protein